MLRENAGAGAGERTMQAQQHNEVVMMLILRG